MHVSISDELLYYRVLLLIEQMNGFFFTRKNRKNFIYMKTTMECAIVQKSHFCAMKRNVRDFCFMCTLCMYIFFETSHRKLAHCPQRVSNLCSVFADSSRSIVVLNNRGPINIRARFFNIEMHPTESRMYFNISSTFLFSLLNDLCEKVIFFQYWIVETETKYFSKRMLTINSIFRVVFRVDIGFLAVCCKLKHAELFIVGN